MFNASGGRLAYNDDISATNRNSRLTVSLTAGQTYYLGVTNYSGAPNGNYTWAIDCPAALTDDRFEDNDSFARPPTWGRSPRSRSSATW